MKQVMDIIYSKRKFESLFFQLFDMSNFLNMFTGPHDKLDFRIPENEFVFVEMIHYLEENRLALIYVTMSP